MSVGQTAVSEAVILMAGVGSRLGRAGGASAKPLVEIGGRPLICYTFEALARAGIRTIHAVMGANSERVSAEVTALLPAVMRFNPIINPDWQMQNGVSVLCAADHVQGPFILAMGDHLFEFALLETLLQESDRGFVNLAVDRKVDSIFDLDDATKVGTDGERLVRIGKQLGDYDAIDTGVFLCSRDIFRYLKAAQRGGDCSLSDGVRLMAADGKVRAIDIGDAWWQDVDTPEMLEQADRESARLLRQSRRGSAEEGVTCQS